MIGWATLLVFLQTVILIFSIDLGRLNKLRIIYLFNLATIALQIILYSFYKFESLEEIFILQILTLSIFILVFFWKTVFVFKKEFTIALFILASSVGLTELYLSNNFQILQLIAFLMSLFYISNLLQKWIKLDSD